MATFATLLITACYAVMLVCDVARNARNSLRKNSQWQKFRVAISHPAQRWVGLCGALVGLVLIVAAGMDG